MSTNLDISSVINLEDYKEIHLPTLYQSQIHLSKYSRWREDLGRRETWPETVYRYMDHIYRQAGSYGYKLPDSLVRELYEAILDLEIMPSMRCMMTAGKALERDNAAGFNCAYLNVNRLKAFDETLYLLACGCGVGFSVERQFVNDLPDLPKELFPTDTVIVVADSKIGWASALRQLLSLLYIGSIPNFDFSKVRKSGAKLKTFGGRASGPGPLNDLFLHIIHIFKTAIENNQRKLSSIQCHSIMTKIGDAIVSGGSRRSAMLSLSNPSDERMKLAKSGQWWVENGHFALANNSAAWTEKPEVEIFMEEWLSLIRSKSGERGIFNREAARAIATKYGKRNPDLIIGCNPCSEVNLRDRQFCNLTEVVVRFNDTLTTLKRKITLASVLGTIQSTLTKFRYLSDKWKENTEEERLLGVSLTGIMDNPLLSGLEGEDILIKSLTELRETIVSVNADFADKLGINPSTAVSCVKPSGTISQLVNCSSGIHPRHSRFYIRTNRFSKTDPVGILLASQGVPCEDDVTKPDTTWVLSFPIAAPEGAVCRKDVTAIDQLKLWLIYQENYCEHKPSITVSVRPDEWLEVGAFVYKHFDKMSGVSFLPMSDHVYRQAPYQDCTEEEYLVAMENMPKTIDWDMLQILEQDDNTEGSRAYACTGNSCELL